MYLRNCKDACSNEGIRQLLGWRVARVMMLLPAAFLVIHQGGCGSSEKNVPLAPDGLNDVVYRAEANDEALEELVGIPAKSDPTRGAIFTAPLDGDVMAGDLPRFTWRDATTTELEPSRTNSGARRHYDLPFGPVRSASAHGPSVNGRAYYLVFSTPDDPKLVRVFTTESFYEPDVVELTKLELANGPIQLSIVTAIYDNSRLAADGGPYIGETIHFSIQQE